MDFRTTSRCTNSTFKAVDIEPKVGAISKLLLNRTSRDLQLNWLPALCPRMSKLEANMEVWNWRKKPLKIFKGKSVVNFTLGIAGL